MYQGNPYLEIINLDITPLRTVIERDKKIAPYISLGEIYDATKVLDSDSLFETGIPIDSRLLDAHTYIREQTGYPLYIGSAYRSPEWEIKKGRSLNQHPRARAIDFNGAGLKQFIKTALTERNEHYKYLRSLGINAFGLYDWGVHLDTREPKQNGDIYFWDEQKKKSKSILIYFILFFVSLFLTKQIKNPFKKIRFR